MVCGLELRVLITRSSLDFGAVQVGTTAPSQTVTVTNIGLSPAVMSGAGGGVGSPLSGFQSCQGNTLNPGASCQMVDRITPTSAGAANPASSRDLKGKKFSLALTDTGVGPQFLITQTSVDFGPVNIGWASPKQTVTVTNIGASAVVMSGAGGGVSSPFSGFQGCQGKTLSPGASCQMVYSFTPTAAGPASTTSSGDGNGQTFNITLTPNRVSPCLIT